MSFKPDVNGPERGTLFDSPDQEPRYTTAPPRSANLLAALDKILDLDDLHRNEAPDCQCGVHTMMAAIAAEAIDKHSDERDSSHDSARLGRRE